MITNTSAQPDGEGGYALAGTSGGRGILRQVWIANGQSAEFTAASRGAIAGEPTEITLEDVIIRTTRPGAGAFAGWAIYISDGGVLRGRRLVIEGDGEVAFAGFDPTLLDLDEIVVLGRGGSVSGMSLAAGPRGKLRRAIIVDSAGRLLEASGPDSPFAPPGSPPSHAVIEDTLTLEITAPWALHLITGAKAEIARVALVGGRHLAAIRVLHEGTDLSLHDVTIEGIDPLDYDEEMEISFAGLGIWATYGVTLNARRWAIRGARTHGIILGLLDMEVDFEDILIEGLGAHSVSAWRGAHGLHVQGAAAITARRMRVAGFGGFGVVAIGGRGQGSSSLILSDLEIASIGQADCKQQGCDDALGGVGLLLMGDALAEVSGFAVHGSALAGMLVAKGGRLRAERGRLTDNLIGLNVQDPAFDWGGAFTDVYFGDNAVDVDSVVAPLPDASDALGAADLDI